MKTNEILRCSCGGRVERPVPPKCPHCGRQIVGVRASRLSWFHPVLIVDALFAALVGFLAWWLTRL
ncbi:MAG: hypothetical protein U0836_01210 [Pirellulales bacterium]